MLNRALECFWNATPGRTWGGLSSVVSWRLLEVSAGLLEAFWRRLGGVLEAFEGLLGAPECILEASGGYLFNGVRIVVSLTGLH